MSHRQPTIDRRGVLQRVSITFFGSCQGLLLLVLRDRKSGANTCGGMQVVGGREILPARQQGNAEITGERWLDSKLPL
jgi:hypothetical protein